MKNYRIRLAAYVALSAVMASAMVLHAQTFELDWFTIDGGGAMRSTDRGFELSGSIAQPDAGPMLSGGAFELTGGFWFALVPDDCNSDGGVNLYDFADLESCSTGPQHEPHDPSCLCFDQDGDGDVDLHDFAAFQAAFQSP